MQYSVSVQTQLPANMVLQIAYVGNKASQLEINKNINALPAQYYNQGAAGVTFLQTQVPNPMAGLLPGSSLEFSNGSKTVPATPFPEFTNVTDNYASRGNVLYNSLQTSVDQASEPWILGPGKLYVVQDHGPEHLSQRSRPSEFALPLSGSQSESRRQPGRDLSVLFFVRQASLSSGGHWADGRSTACFARRMATLWRLPEPPAPREVMSLRSPVLAWVNATYGRYFNTCYENAAGALVMTTASAPGCDSASSIPAFQQHLSFTLNNIGPYMNDVRQMSSSAHSISRSSNNSNCMSLSTSRFEESSSTVLNTPNFGGPNTTPERQATVL